MVGKRTRARILCDDLGREWELKMFCDDLGSVDTLDDVCSVPATDLLLIHFPSH